MLKRKSYAGQTRRLPGEIPQLRGVTRYPGQGQAGDSKVPSVMYYDSGGNLKAVGYQALKDGLVEEATTKGWTKLEWWKLHLRPKHLSAHIKDDDIPPLPRGKTIVDVFSDFIKYLFQCAETYIQESHPRYLWSSVKDDIQFIFTHPNGWEGPQQQKMRRAIELAGLVPSTAAGRARVRFLTEGEAGLHFCVWDLFASGLPEQEKYPQGQGVVVIDAGGGTLDLSMYSMKFGPTSFEEIAPAECRLQGSVFVTRRAKALLKRKLDGSHYSSPETIDDITNTFDKTTKLHIDNAKQPVYIKVGGPHQKDPAHNIQAGKLKLSGQEATKLFDDSISAVIHAFEQQHRCVNMPITMAFLIGGFGASDWLWSQLESYFKSKGIELSRPNRVHKAVPDGALSYFIDHLVKSRVARATYGTKCMIPVDKDNSEHISRKKTWDIDAAGELVVPNGFKGILYKGVPANEKKEFKHSFRWVKSHRLDFGDEQVPILCYRGRLPDPQWTDRDKESFSRLCTVRFDSREAAKTLTPKKKLNGEGFYYSLSFVVVILFGATEFSAHVTWGENGVNKSPAVMIYDEN